MPLPAEGEIRWGTGNDNVLAFAYPAALDDVRTWRRPAPGSRTVRNPAGTSDSWIQNRDFLLAGTARWFRQSLWGGLGLQDFLDWATVKNTFRFIPDRNYPSFYVDNCYLDEPFEDPAPTLEETDGSQSIGIVIRQQAFDFSLAARGLLFEYVPGKSLTDPSVATFSRASVAKRIGRDGVVAEDAIDVLRDRHFETGVRATLIEAPGTNSLLWSTDFSNAAWVKTTTTVTTGIADPAGGTAACTLTATGANADTRQTLAAGASTRRTNAVWLRRRTGTGTIKVTDPTGAGEITPTLTSSWQRFSNTSNPSVNRIFGIVLVTSGDEIDVWNGQLEDGTFATSDIVTTTVAVTRATDTLSYPFSFVPQEMTVYCKFVERGTAQGAGDGLWGLAAVNGNSPRFIEFGGGGGGSGIYTTQHNNNVISAVSALSPAVAYGDTIESRSILLATGAVQRGTSINGGAETVSSASSAAALAAAWGATKIHIGGRGTALVGFSSIIVLKIAAGTKTMAEMRAI